MRDETKIAEKERIDAIKAAFKIWFFKKWNELDAQLGKRTTQQELADILAIARPTISHYATGRKVPEGENLEKIAKVFGPEVYDVIGVSRPIPEMPPEYVELFFEIKSAIEKLGVEPESPEAVKIANEILDDFVSRRKESL